MSVVTTITPDETEREFWDSFANILGAEQNNLSNRIELEVLNEDYNLIKKFGPYFRTSLFKQVLADTDKPFGYAETLYPRISIIKKDTYDDWEIPSLRIKWPDQNLLCLDYVLNTRFSPSESPLILQCNCLSKKLASAAMGYFFHAIVGCLTTDCSVENARRILPYHGLGLVKLPSQQEPC